MNIVNVFGLLNNVWWTECGSTRTYAQLGWEAMVGGKPSVNLTFGWKKEVEPETTPSLLMIFESAATQFLSMIYESVVSHMRWWLQRRLWNCVALMIFELAATKFSSTISESIVNHMRWWFQCWLWNYIALMISESTATQFSSTISESAMNHMRWWFLSR